MKNLRPAGLEPSPDEMRALVRTACERVVRHMESLPEQPASDEEGGTRAAERVMEPLPEHGQPLDGLLDLFQEIVR